MEDVIEKNFCGLCMKHECKNCMKLYIERENKVLTYGCANYEPMLNKHPLKHFDYENYEIRSNKIKYDLLEVERYGRQKLCRIYFL